MDLKALRYFIAVAETGNMTRAATLLGIQQPPLSQHVKTLESELGIVLFRRHPRGMALTDAGQHFHDEALRMLQHMDAMQQRMARIAQGEAGALAVGVTSSVLAHRFMPDALRAFRRSYPKVELRLEEDSATALTEHLLSGSLHCALLRVPVTRPDALVFETLLSEPVVVAMSSDHRYAASAQRDRPLTLAHLCSEGMILLGRPGEAGLYAELLSACEALGLQPQVVAEVDRMMTNLSLVAAGVGVSVVPASMNSVHPHAICYRALDARHGLEAPLTLVSRREEDHLPARHFADLLRSLSLREEISGPPIRRR